MKRDFVSPQKCQSSQYPAFVLVPTLLSTPGGTADQPLYRTSESSQSSTPGKPYQYIGVGMQSEDLFLSLLHALLKC